MFQCFVIFVNLIDVHFLYEPNPPNPAKQFGSDRGSGSTQPYLLLYAGGTRQERTICHVARTVYFFWIWNFFYLKNFYQQSLHFLRMRLINFNNILNNLFNLFFLIKKQYRYLKKIKKFLVKL